MRDARRGFVILTTQRSGSNWVEDRLDSHPELLLRRSEIFRRSLTSQESYTAFRQRSRSTRLASAVSPPLAKMLFLHQTLDGGGAMVPGFRLMYDQLRRSPALALLLRLHLVRVVHLVRENVLATHISAERAKVTGIYMRNRRVDSDASVYIETEHLVAALAARQRKIDRHRLFLRAFEHIEVGYESYIAQPEHHDQRICGFLKVGPAEHLGSNIVRLSRGGPLALVSNRQEVAETLAGTPFEAMALENSPS